MSTKWTFNKDLPIELEQASRDAFRPVWHSAVLSLGKQYNWLRLADGWHAGLGIGSVTAIDQSGDKRTWDVSLYEAGDIMQHCEGASKWQIRIDGRID